MKKLIQAGALCTAILLFGACQTPQIAFPKGNDKKNFTTYDVKGRGGLPIFQKISFAGYTAKISRGWTTSTSSSDLLEIETESKSSQKYSFEMDGPNGFSAKGECVSKASETVDTIKIGKYKTSGVSESKSTLKGICVVGSKKIELLMEANDGSEKYGSITEGAYTLEIAGTKELEGKSYGTWDTCGYYISNKGKLVAAIQVFNSGKVFIANDLDESLKPAVLTSIMALLAYQDVKRK